MNSHHTNLGYGTKQNLRCPRALNPSYAQVDERDLPTLLAFIAQYSELLNFYDMSGNIVGDWQPFFTFDISFLLAQICVSEAPTDALDEAAHAYRMVQDENNAHKMLRQIFSAASKINHWYCRAKCIADNEQEDNPLHLTLEATIQQDLKRYYQQILQTPVWQRYWENLAERQGTTFDALWHAIDKDKDKKIWSDNLFSILNAFDRAIKNLRQLARRYLEESLTLKTNHAPHTALLAAFARLFGVVQAELNTYTRRHLDYYFNDILRLSPRPGQVDLAHLSFVLAPHINNYLLEAGTLLTAGKDQEGKDIIFSTEKNLWLNQTQIAALKTVRITHYKDPAQERPPLMTKVLAYSVLDSPENINALTNAEKTQSAWATFGCDGSALASTSVQSSAPYAELGFVIASPLLLLKEGERTITLTFSCDDGSHNHLQKWLQAYQAYLKATLGLVIEDNLALLADSCRVYLSGPTGWFEATQIEFTGDLPMQDLQSPTTSQKLPALSLSIKLAPLAPPVVENPALEPQNQETAPLPMLKLIMNQAAHVCAYPLFKKLVEQKLLLNVSVQGLKNIQLENQLGAIAEDKPFPPFGMVPVVGSYLQISDRELSKPFLHKVNVVIEWMNFPLGNDLTAHYTGYQASFTNDLFKVHASRYLGDSWEPLASLASNKGYDKRSNKEYEFFLFDPPVINSSARQECAAIASTTCLPLIFTHPLSPAAMAAQARQEREVARSLSAGSLRIALSSPAYAFGHALYPTQLTAAILANSRLARYRKDTDAVLPNPPFVPIIKSLSVDYEACEVLDLSADYCGQDSASSMHSRFYHIAPFGYVEEIPGMTPQYSTNSEQGQLHIGLSGLKPPETVTLLFQMQDRLMQQSYAGISTAVCPKPVVVWRYLSHNVWKPLSKQHILGDTTKALTCSGILKLQIPSDINTDNTLMPSGIFWLSALVLENIEYVSDTIKIYTQAVSAKRLSEGESGCDYTIQGNLPAQSIYSLVEKAAEIKSVVQPFATTGGRFAETTEQFEMRVSERLKHKQRAIQPGDYERLVLEAFPEIEQAKCVGPNNSRGYKVQTTLKPGQVVLAVVPVRASGSSLEAQQVPHSTLWDIADYLRKHASPFVQQIQVCNPIYEQLKVFATVKFYAGNEALHDVTQLNHAINHFLAPWQKNMTQAIPLGCGELRVENIAAFIKQLPYVQRLIDITVLHLYPLKNQPQEPMKWQERWLERTDIAYPTSAWSVLMPVAQHAFNHVRDINLSTLASIDRGIGSLTIGSDLLVSQTSKTVPHDAGCKVTSASEQRRHRSFFLSIATEKVFPKSH